MHLNKKEVNCHLLHITLHIEKSQKQTKTVGNKVSKTEKKINMQKSVLVYSEN